MRKFILSSFLLLLSLASSAQFRVVDAADGNSLEYVYVYSQAGKVLGTSDKNGQVAKYTGKITLSLLGYEQQTVDADTCRSDVKLKVLPNELNEVVVGGDDYIKRTCAFRDVFRNNDSIVIFREGIADYYYNLKTKSTKRRIRACRQIEHPRLRRLTGNYPQVWDSHSLNLCKIFHVEKGKAVAESGDTTLYSASVLGKKTEVIKEIDDSLHHRYRSIIDQKRMREDVLPVQTKVLKWMNEKWEDDVIEWTYSDKSHSASSLISCRHHKKMIHGNKHPVMEDDIRELVVVSQTGMSKQEAKREMKDKTITKDFTMPDCMPKTPFNVEEQTKGLVQRDFWESSWR